MVMVVRKFQSFLESIYKAGASRAIRAIEEVDGAVDVSVGGLK